MLPEKLLRVSFLFQLAADCQAGPSRLTNPMVSLSLLPLTQRIPQADSSVSTPFVAWVSLRNSVYFCRMVKNFMGLSICRLGFINWRLG